MKDYRLIEIELKPKEIPPKDDEDVIEKYIIFDSGIVYRCYSYECYELDRESNRKEINEAIKLLTLAIERIHKIYAKRL